MWSETENVDLTCQGDVKSELMSCRGCLGAGRLYNVHQYGLAEPYRQLVGVEIREKSGMPQHLCHMCKALVIKWTVFRERCRRSEMLLQSLAVVNPVILTEDISSIDRYAQKLVPSYTQTEPYITDSREVEDIIEYKVEMNVDENSDTGFNYENDPNLDVNEDRKVDICLLNTAITDSANKENKQETEIRVGEKRKRVKNEYVIVKKEKFIEIELDMEENETGERKKRKVNDYVLLSDPEVREKFSQKYNVDVMMLSKEDEKNDMVARQNSPKYLRASYKCEQCFKGFVQEDTLKKHIGEKHDPSMEHVCEFCRFRFRKSENLAGHYRRQHKYKYICRICSNVTRLRVIAVSHYKRHFKTPRTKTQSKVRSRTKVRTKTKKRPETKKRSETKKLSKTKIRPQTMIKAQTKERTETDKKTSRVHKYECKYCGKTFQTKGWTYRKHLRVNHSAEMPWCRICGEAFECIITHMKRRHSQALNPAPELQCAPCGLQFLSAAARRDHARAPCAGLPACLHCGRPFDSEAQLREHVLALHKIQLPCVKDDIEVVVMSREQQIEDMQARKSSSNYLNGVFKCDKCYKGFQREVTFKNHMFRHDPESGAFECDICLTRWVDLRTLRDHKQVHNKKYLCKLCNNVSRNQYQAKEHALWHKGYMYICNMCGASFQKTTSYLGHLRMRHPSKHSCELCGESFVGEAGLNIHMKKTHRYDQYDKTYVEGELKALHEQSLPDPDRVLKPTKYKQKKVIAICDICGCKRSSKNTLINHMRIHTGEKPFQCPECPKKFSVPHGLEIHMRTHTGERPYKCPVCPKAFKQHTAVLRHQLVHTGAKPHQCPQCGKSFTQSYSVKMHVKTVHEGMPQPYRRPRTQGRKGRRPEDQ